MDQVIVSDQMPSPTSHRARRYLYRFDPSRVRAAMKARGLTKRDINAALAAAGITSRLEALLKVKHGPSAVSLCAIARCTGKNMDFFMVEAA